MAVLVFLVFVVASKAIAGAKIISDWLRGVPVWQIGIVLMVLLTAVNLMSTRSYGEFEFWFSSIKVAAILVFIMIAGAFAFGLTSGKGPTFDNFWAVGGFAPGGIGAALAGVTALIFTLVERRLRQWPRPKPMRASG